MCSVRQYSVCSKNFPAFILGVCLQTEFMNLFSVREGELWVTLGRCGNVVRTQRREVFGLVREW